MFWNEQAFATGMLAGLVGKCPYAEKLRQPAAGPLDAPVMRGRHGDKLYLATGRDGSSSETQ